ncbi:MAG: ferrochelatase [Acidobacteria bacterium]|nr:ferrochelatase [Acidobacteriota bacterium]MCZ6768315.1 ferrochelatase [Acidobacteriota bacterium]MCZ6877047.1 ferrochelatase [Acidobacteriota bacterium]
MKSSSLGVLIMAYGSAPSLDDQAIFRYLQHILQYYRKTEPTQEEFQNLKERYHSVGGSPLYSVAEKIAAALQDTLDLSFPERFRVYLAMKHSPPFIEDRVSQMADSGVRQAIAVALAPFRSRLSTEGYYRLVRESNQQLGEPIQWSFVQNWNIHPLFLELWRSRIEETLHLQDTTPTVIFTNHSLPARIEEWKDPYTNEFEMAAQALAKKCRLSQWTIAYQSDGGGSEPWLGPNLQDVLRDLRTEGKETCLLAPIGFLMDHLEILYDLDVSAQAQAKEIGMRLSRTQMPNDDPLLVKMLSDLVAGKFMSELAKT